MSLLHRHPGRIEHLKNSVALTWERHGRGFFESRFPGEGFARFDSYAKTMTPERLGDLAIPLARRLIDSDQVGRHLNAMTWFIRRLPEISFELLSSDRPLIVSLPPANPDSAILLPIGPRLLFGAVNRWERIEEMDAIDDDKFAATINRIVVGNALRHVLASDASQRRFVEDQFARSGLPAGAYPFCERLF